MVVMMLKTKIKLDGPAVRPSATEIPVFEELRLGQFILVRYLTIETAEQRKAA